MLTYCFSLFIYYPEIDNNSLYYQYFQIQIMTPVTLFEKIFFQIVVVITAQKDDA